MKDKDADELTLAIQTVRIYQEAFENIRDTMIKGKVDMRIFDTKTRDLLLHAGRKRDELIRRIELKETEMIQPTGKKH